MNQSVLVSVIVPCFNAIHTLDCALASILANSGDGIAVEIIVVDDHSTDGSVERLRDYGNAIHLIALEANVGVSAARNAGVEVARGEFVAFCDADDVWYPDKLKQQLPLFANPAIGLVCSDIDLIDCMGEAIEKPWRTRFKRGWVYRDLLCHNFIGTSSTVLRREVCFAERFNVGIRHAEDLDLWLRVARRWQVDFVDKPLLQYRLSASQATRNWNAMQDSRLQVICSHASSLPFFLKRKVIAAARFRYGMACWEERDFRKARRQFLRAVIENPISPWAWVRLAAAALPKKVLFWILEVKKSII